MRTRNLYTPPPKTNTFLYTNYYEFAAHKLHACEYMVNQLEKLDDSALEKKVCHDLFYLMGYIVEGLSVYVIYDFIEWDKKKQISWYDRQVEEDYDISYDGRNTTYSIKTHKFNHYLAVVRGKEEVSSIPFISGRDHFDHSYKLLQKWDPLLRYDYKSVQLNKADIIALYKYCDKMFGAVSDQIGIPV